MKKILVIGKTGQLGSCINEIITKNPNKYFSYTFVDFPEFDLSKEADVIKTMAADNYDYCINCAAYTAVDLAEKEVDLAYAINATGVGILATECAKKNTVLVHVSTDYVFDGMGTKPYTEDMPTDPINVYGQSKLLGEQNALTNNPASFILRTSWLYSPYGKNFVKTMKNLMKDRPALSIVADQKGSPTNAQDLAAAILTIITSNSKAYGIYHYSNEGETTWCDFTKAIAEVLGATTVISPIATVEYPTPAKRPMYSTMDKTLVKNTFNITIPNWRDSLTKMIKNYSLD